MQGVAPASERRARVWPDEGCDWLSSERGKESGVSQQSPEYCLLNTV